MSMALADENSRKLFREEHGQNFAVNANAGSGKTTEISNRLAMMALSPDGQDLMRKTVVVTFTKKAATEIRLRARSRLIRYLADRPEREQRALDYVDRAFFGTIHSFCLLLGRRFGQPYGISLDPQVVNSDDKALWENFSAQDEMTFHSVAEEDLRLFLRFSTLEALFHLAQEMGSVSAKRILERSLLSKVPAFSETVFTQILSIEPKGSGKARSNITGSQALLTKWVQAYHEKEGYMPIPSPMGKAASLPELFEAYFLPLKEWLAEVGGRIAAELSERYRLFRLDRGIQTYTDQVEIALSIIQNTETLDRIRRDGYRVILDEAQDTDPEQFSVLVEITREPGEIVGTWPGGGKGPRDGHFCMVGDGQQSIFGGRADIRNYLRHIDGFRKGDCGELLAFEVTFRLPEVGIDFINRQLSGAFGKEREHNLGLNNKLMQVPYQRLKAINGGGGEGFVSRLVLDECSEGLRVEERLYDEVHQIAKALHKIGVNGLGIEDWSQVAILAPRNAWLVTAEKAFKDVGIPCALQMKGGRKGDHPVYAWMCGLLSVICDPENAFEWAGVLRELFEVSDDSLASVFSDGGQLDYASPEVYPDVIADALRLLSPFIVRCDEAGVVLEAFTNELIEVCHLRERSDLVDESGASRDELEMLVHQAATIGVEGGGPRTFLATLLRESDEPQSVGRNEVGSLNLLTCYSAKGLEWPVVIPIGLWRSIGIAPHLGFRLIREREGSEKIYFDTASLTEEVAQARNRERLRELSRLLYVTLTRFKKHLIIPFGFSPEGKKEQSFWDLWGLADGSGLDEGIEALPELVANVPIGSGEEISDVTRIEGRSLGKLRVEEVQLVAAKEWSLDIPQRVLPHELADHGDKIRTLLHESGSEAPMALDSVDDPLEYGLWWHETMEFLPWKKPEEERGLYFMERMDVAERLGFNDLAFKELQLLKDSSLWEKLIDPMYRILTEIAVFAPTDDEKWIDGIIDMLITISSGEEVIILDWKTNRRKEGESDEAFLERLKEMYQPQLDAYRYGIKEITGYSNVSTQLYATAIGRDVSF
jgi:ATP-dependent helicase/nuclease subunit A